MNPEQWLSLKWNGGSTMSDRWLNQSKIIQKTYKNLSKPNIWIYLIGSRSEQEIHTEPYPNGKEVNFYGEISFTI